MPDFNTVHKSVLQRYNRPIVHMRKQVLMNRFGLVFGAGLSRGFGIPAWESLVQKVAKDPEVKGQSVLKIVPPHAGLPYQTEMLFEHFRHGRYAKAPAAQHHTRTLDYHIGSAWREIVRKHLYASVDGKMSELLDRHPYFNAYLRLIRQSSMTVTYNFDDFIEQSLLRSIDRSTATSRGFESVTNPWTQFRHKTAIIYHPNGVVPQNALETPSDRFVFSEASFAEQLMGIFAGDQAGLVNHLSKHTCLMIGLSLEDDTLRNVLLQGARSCPGNYHYYVHYCKPGERLDKEKKRAVSFANFKVYNLITLFLNDDDIRALGELIDVETFNENALCDASSVHNIPIRFRFYIVGALGVGKSTTINHFRNLVVLDEWLDERPAILSKNWSDLSVTERKAADDWIVNQFGRKNEVLRHAHEGIFVLDRGPIDPLAFTPDDEWSAKADNLLKTICPGMATWQVEDGRVIFLQGDGEELALRMIMTQRKGYTAEKLRSMEERLRKAYGDQGVITYDTRGLTSADVARRVAEIVHLEPYEPTCNLHKRLEDIVEDGFNVS